MSVTSRVCWFLFVLFSGALPASAFDCDHTYCPKMSSCAEAYYKLSECGHSERDADDDGIPCENVCGKDLEIAQKRAIAQWPKTVPMIATLKPGSNPVPGGGGFGFIPPAQADPVRPDPSETFACAPAKKTCKQMLSCEEATYHLKTCGQSKLDGNGDGVACNTLCR